ncbi:MAG: hypothetical protein K0U08_01475 [Proteobacteria bacterium]|nr:hypothetical protein [Pseudomonadota bacterium]MCH9712192.1 hypothetical protein [Pseudomonadota bacterium]MCH9749250.1 hypothetical protein [Pseudomonadota bacterium]
MKKQLLIAAVAATMTSAAFAELSITGDAKYEYKNTDISATATTAYGTASGATTLNTGNTEVNIKMVGKSGDTTVVLNQEFNTHGSQGGSSSVDTEDMYISTKIGDIAVKAGHYASGTSGILGEIDNGSRATDKVTLSTELAGVNVYMGDAETSGEMKGNMFYGVKGNVAGFTVEAKRVNTTADAFAVSGDVAGVAVRYETKSVDGTDNDVDFLNLTTSMNGFDLGYAMIDADSDGKITEDDSSIFAVENGLLNTTANEGYGDSNQQITIGTKVAGNTVTFAAGSIGFKAADIKDVDYNQIDVKRALASGATLALTYTQLEGGVTGAANVDVDVDQLELDLSVKF